jgi:hypothetical protein
MPSLPKRGVRRVRSMASPSARRHVSHMPNVDDFQLIHLSLYRTNWSLKAALRLSDSYPSTKLLHHQAPTHISALSSPMRVPSSTVIRLYLRQLCSALSSPPLSLSIAHLTSVAVSSLECRSFWGTTLNPFNTSLSSGGSSGGEGALVAMRGSPLGVGSAPPPSPIFPQSSLSFSQRTSAGPSDPQQGIAVSMGSDPRLSVSQ